VIIGGHHVTGLPESLDKPFDVGVMGEGEGALSDIVELLKHGNSYTTTDLKKIPNLVFRDTHGNLILNPKRPLLAPEEIPVNQWDLLPKEHIVQHKILFHDGVVTSEALTGIFTARGCPYRCIFCARQVLWKEGGGYRVFPIDYVVDEMELLYKKYHISHIWFADDTFAVSKERLRKFIEELRKRKLLGVIKIPGVFVRSNLVDREVVDLLKELGVYRVTLGIESGSNKMLRYLKSGPITVQQVKNAIQLFAKQGIYVGGNIMLFSPHETPHDLALSYKLSQWFIKQPNAVSLDFYLTTPYPGTGLWNEAVREGVLDSKKVNSAKFVLLPKFLDVNKYIFFRNGKSTKFLQREWKRFYSLSERLRLKVEKTPGWETAIQRKEKENRLNDIRFAMKVRIRLFINNPLRGVWRLCTNSAVWKRIYFDTMQLLKNLKSQYT